MKLTLDQPTLEVFGKLCQYGLKQEFPDLLFQKAYRTALESLIIKFHKATARILKALPLQKPVKPGKKRKLPTASITLDVTEALNFRWTIEFFNKDLPDSYEFAVSQKHFLEPLKQITL